MKVALCVRIELADGELILATSADFDLLVTLPGFDGVYRSVAAFDPTVFQQRASLQVDSLDLSSIVRIEGGISARDVANGRLDRARVWVFEIENPANPTRLCELTFGVLGKATIEYEGELRVELLSIDQLLSQTVGQIYTPRCRARLGSGSEAPVLRRCGVSLAAFTFDVLVTSIVDRGNFFCAALIQDEGFFTHGTVTFLDGANAGVKREVLQHEENGELFLYEPVPFDIELNDEVRVVAGCDKTIETCSNKFDNVANFRGEPLIPGPGYLVRTAEGEG